MGYNTDEFKFLQRTPNVAFMCNDCVGYSSAKVLDTAKAMMNEIIEMKTVLGDVKQAVQTVQTGTNAEHQAKLCSDVLKSKSE